MRSGSGSEEIVPAGTSSGGASGGEASGSVPLTEILPNVQGDEPSGSATPQPLVRLETMEHLIKQFRDVAGSSGYMCQKDFKNAADIKSKFFANRLFQAIDQDQNGCITCDEYVNFMYDLQCQNAVGRIRGLFNLYDIDGSGGLSYAELVELLTASVEESNSQMEPELIEHLADCIMTSFDADGNGEISFQEFVAAVSKHPQLLSGLTVVGLGSDNSKKGLGVITTARNAIRQAVRMVVNNPQRTFWVLLLIAGLAMMFWWRAGRYSSGYKCELMSWTLPVAKGCGQMIKLTTTLILLPVSRRTTTFLRETPLRHFIPFDDAISFHILLGTLGFIFAWVHALCHVHDFLRWGDPQRNSQFKKAFPEESRQPSHYELWTSLLGITGVLQLITYTLVFLTASNWPRRAPWFMNTRLGKRLNDFRVIWYVHHLTVVFMGSLLVHGVPHIPNESREWAYSDVWAWVGIPVFVYIMERIGRLYRQTKPVRILSAELLPGKVIALKMSKPRGFSYDCGMYAYVNCPNVSHYEWHPFSLTSAPGAKHLSMHIRVVGDWTEELYNRFRDYGDTLRHEEFGVSQRQSVLPKLQTMGHRLQLQPQTKGNEAIPLMPKDSRPHGPKTIKERLEQLWNQSPGRRGLSVAADVRPESSVHSDVLDTGEEYLSVERSLYSTHPETPPSRMPTPRNDVLEAVQVEVARAAGPKYVTPPEEYFLTRMAPSPILSHLPVPKTPAQAYVAIKTPFAAYEGPSYVSDANEGHPVGKEAFDERGCSVTPSRLSNRNSFLLDFAHVKDAINEDGDISNHGKSLPVHLLLDGPFGAPAQGYRDYPVLLLVGAGIGVTPFASVLSDLVQRMSNLPKGDEETGLEGMPHLKKVYFHWSIRSQSEVVWFSRVLEAIAKEDAHGLLDVNVHITGLRSANDVRTMPLKLVQVAIHRQTGVDVMSGLRCRVLTRFGRPDWSKTFRDLQIRHKREKIGVFYSGPNTLASVLRRLSHKYSKRGSKFHFVKESFGYW